jgi:hypothetical protein
MVSAREPFKVGHASIANFSFCFKLTVERGAQATVFPATTVTFGDDIDGVGGKAGMRVSW